MRLLLILLLAFVTTNCAELHHKVLGTRVQSFEVKGIQYVHCSILMDRAKSQVAHDSIEVCRDELQAPVKK